MQVAHSEAGTNNVKKYQTVKDNEVVFLHPSTSIKDNPEW